jgi:putative transposase
MARHARLRVAGIPLHVIQRGNNRAPCFMRDSDFLNYLGILHHLAGKLQCRIHAYVLMGNHVHLLATPEQASGVSLLMKHLGQRYVQYFNKVHRRSGSLWEGRFRSSLVESETYLLCCQRYIEMNPVRAGMVARPEQYRWSSFHANGLGRADTLVTPHEEYRRLGPSEEERRSAYRELFQSQVEPAVLQQIRSAANGGYALGSEWFQVRLGAALGRRVAQGERGRPAGARKLQPALDL